MKSQIIEKQFSTESLKGFSKNILEFIQWFSEKQKLRNMLSIRDILTWCNFMSAAVRNLSMNPYSSFVHGAAMILMDGLGFGSGISASMRLFRDECSRKLLGNFLI